MSDNLCLPKTHLLIIFCVLIGLSVWYIQINQQKQTEYNQLLLNNINQISKQNTEKNDPLIVVVKNDDKNIELENKDLNPEQKNNDLKQYNNSFLEKRIILEHRDAEVKYNDFKPPERRVPEYIYPTPEVKQLINIPTRGYPDNYQLMGVLLRDNTETAFNLFGRQKYPGSNQYEYYAQGTMYNNHVKLPINKKDDRELYDGDEVNIPGTDSTKGLFKVKLYDLDVPRYNPYKY